MSIHDGDTVIINGDGDVGGETMIDRKDEIDDDVSSLMHNAPTVVSDCYLIAILIKAIVIYIIYCFNRINAN